MARTARPSDIYRLPEQTAPGRRTIDPPPPPPPGRRVPAWLWVAVVLGVILVASGLIGGVAGPPSTGDVPLVDIISEDQAIAALALYGAETDTIASLRNQRDIFDGGGPFLAAGVAERGAAEVQRTLDAARDVNNPDPLYSAFVGSAAHAESEQALSSAAATAQTIALLASTHDSIYAGSGAIAMEEAYQSISGVIAAGDAPEPVRRWAIALIEQIENRPRSDQAFEARADTAAYWAALVASLEPAAVAELQTYLNGLPAVTVEGLRGHPVAGPALDHLEETRRQVSTGTTSPSGRR